jgi:hypothetical protein
MGGAGDGAPDIPNAACDRNILWSVLFVYKPHRPTGPVKLQEYETYSALEAQRCRRAQYTGRIATVVLAGSTVTGMVRSVVEDNSSSLKRWIVAIDPTSLPPTFPFRKKLRTSSW